MSRLQKRHAKDKRREEKKAKRMLTTRVLCERFNVVDRTIDRWVEAKILPQPMWLNGRRYWPEEEIEAVERAALGARTAPDSERTRLHLTEVESAAV
jgi:predicted DNA-binding transcriptional regulator AlpA